MIPIQRHKTKNYSPAQSLESAVILFLYRENRALLFRPEQKQVFAVGERFMNSGKIRRIAALSNASVEKKRLATEATDKAIRNLTSLNQSITVANVARLAGVSTSYIYKYPELKERIDSLKNQQIPVRTSQKVASNSSQTTIIYTLREEIKRLNIMLGESKNANQLLIGKIYQQPETQNIVEYFKDENKKQVQQIQELQNEIDIIKQ
ncbi:transposase [Nostoc flagelliforme CCNUN1]|uniref:Transposase n=1 Tax=Nostoc flagelliforme CCNUN1 TaxID=2038116 RepID=A0A2K8SI32_9NOSO|nr:DUF6262 family protein [Nostoc flagelliforme]AUB35126.1 transposase [Nostoc flagelliforme CCNUN1]